jgi:hypothetical protein
MGVYAFELTGVRFWMSGEKIYLQCYEKVNVFTSSFRAFLASWGLSTIPG